MVRSLVALVALSVATMAVPALGARSQPVRISPTPVHLRDTVVFSWRATYGTDNAQDGYRLRFTGPGGDQCRSRTTYTAGLTWPPQDNARYRNHRVQVSVGSRRQPNPPPAVGLSWCPGTYKGRLVFRDYPFGKTAPVVYRFVGTFQFRAR